MKNENYLQKIIEFLHNAQKNNNKEEKIKAYTKLAQYYYSQKNFNKAKLNLEEIEKINPNLEDINYYHALIELSKNNKSNNAKKYLLKEIKINPNNSKAKILLEKIHIHTNLPLTSIGILIIIIITFLMSFPQPNYETLLKFGFSNLNNNITTLFTSIFFHANIYHLILNSIILALFGLYLEKFIGSIKFATILIFSALIGNFFEMFLSNSNTFVIGISAGLFGIFGAIVMREPLLEIRVLGIFKIPIIILFGLIFILQWILSLLIQNNNLSFGDTAHMFGFLCGIFLMGIIEQKTIKVFYNWIAIAFGFAAITYSLSKIYSSILGAFIINEIFIAITSLIIGIFLIFYSYLKLKIMSELTKL